MGGGSSVLNGKTTAIYIDMSRHWYVMCVVESIVKNARNVRVLSLVGIVSLTIIILDTLRN